MIKRWPTTPHRLIVALLGAILATGCGVGGGNDGGQVAGIEGTGIVSGFGSVYVNGIEFATNDSEIVVNGQRASEADLQVGDVVTVRGQIDADGSARARRIVFDRSVDGPIDTLDLSDGTGELTALGQTVRVTADTQFINLEPEDLSEDDLIAVSGVAGDDGDLRATSIRRGSIYTPGATRVDVEGVIRDLGTGTFNIGGQQVAFAGATRDEGAGALRDGAYVEVFGVRGPGTDAPLEADRVTVRSRDVGAAGNQVFIESVITDFNGPADFRLNGQRVDASDAERVDTETIALADGRTVAVRGILRNGVVGADTLRVAPEPTATLNASLAGVDAENDMLTLLGVNARVQPTTLYLDRSSRDDRRLRIGRLAAGDTLRVSGYRSADGLVVTWVERTEPQANGTAEARGPLEDIERNGGSALLHIAGVAIRTRDSATRFIGTDGETLEPDAFFQRIAIDTPIAASGPENAGQIDTARTVRIGD